MTAQRRRLEALQRLSIDPGATEAERRLAAERLAQIMASSGESIAKGNYKYIEVEVDDELVAALDRAMARIATVRSPAYRRARIHAAERRAGRTATKAWREGRGPELKR